MFTFERQSNIVLARGSSTTLPNGKRKKSKDILREGCRPHLLPRALIRFGEGFGYSRSAGTGFEANGDHTVPGALHPTVSVFWMLHVQTGVPVALRHACGHRNVEFSLIEAPVRVSTG